MIKQHQLHKIFEKILKLILITKTNLNNIKSYINISITTLLTLNINNISISLPITTILISSIT